MNMSLSLLSASYKFCHLLLLIGVASAYLSPPSSVGRCSLRYHRGSSSTYAARRSSTSLNVFFNNNKPNFNNNNKTPPSGSGDDLVKTLELKDEALLQAQTAVSSLESALESAVTNLEYMQEQLQLRVIDLEKELTDTKNELSISQDELDIAVSDLQLAQQQLTQSQKQFEELEVALGESEEAARRAELRAERLQSELASLKENQDSSSGVAVAEKKSDNNPWNNLFQSASASAASSSIPTLNEWIAIKGSAEGDVQISGKVINHPTIDDGDAIVTSPLVDPSQAKERKVVSTSSGSKYRLGTPLTLPSSAASVDVNEAKNKFNKQKEERRQQILARARTSSETIPEITDQTLGNGRYILAGQAVPSVNGRSLIQTAYRSSPVGTATGEPLIIKISSNTDAMRREYDNYQRVSGGLKKGQFIRRKEFLPKAGDEMPGYSALVMQRGVDDVKAFMPKVGGRLEGPLLLDCAATALRCMEALHGVRLVWNDLKTENFVVVEDERTGDISFRGIDLESCMPVKSNPIDYTPEACPPEFAKSFMSGDAESFALEYSYDVWSYGMFLYEISTGRGFFDGVSAEQITKRLPTFEPMVDKVPDPTLADLITKCLSTSPRDRPSVARISRHPYFDGYAGNKNPFEFLFGNN
jgi:serine/threonine protein kinase